jgi:hypothetical protein
MADNGGQHRQPFGTVEQHQVITGRDVVVLDAELLGGFGAAGGSNASGSWVFSCFAVFPTVSLLTLFRQELETALHKKHMGLK